MSTEMIKPDEPRRHSPETRDKIAKALVGNDNAKRGAVWSRAVKLALYRKDDKGIRALHRAAKALVDRAIAGDPKALKELGDRVEGSVKRQLELAGAGGGPLQVIVGTKDSDVV